MKSHETDGRRMKRTVPRAILVTWLLGHSLIHAQVSEDPFFEPVAPSALDNGQDFFEPPSASAPDGLTSPELPESDNFFDAASDGNSPPRQNERVHPLSLQISVKTPDGQPAVNASVVRYDGTPLRIDVTDLNRIHISGVDDTRGQQVSESSRKLVAVTDAEGVCSISRGVGPLTLVAMHDSGYLIVSSGDFDAPDLQLQPWARSKTLKLSFCGQPLSGCKVLTRWESFPHLPALVTEVLENREISVPPLVTFVREHRPSDEGVVEITGVPVGRIAVEIGESDGGTAAGGCARWMTTEAPETGDNIVGDDPFTSAPAAPEQLEFDGVHLFGQIEITDKVYRELAEVSFDPVSRTTRVNQLQGRLLIQYGRPPMTDLLEHSGVMADSSAFDGPPNPGMQAEVARLLSDAVVWGRDGGRREEFCRNAIVPVGTDGRFNALIPPPQPETTVYFIVPERTGDGSASVHAFRSAAGDIFSLDDIVPSTDGGGTGVRTLDAGLINIDDRLDARFIPPGQPLNPEEAFDFALRPADPAGESSAPPILTTPVPFESRPEDPFGAEGGGNPFMTETPAEGPFRSSPTNAPENAGSRVSPSLTDPIDHAVAELVVEILAAGDLKTHERLRVRLSQLLSERFDAEQRAREQLVRELRNRLNEASRLVEARKQDRERIIREQVERMMGLPLDSFQPIPPDNRPEPVLPPTEPASVDDVLPEPGAS